MKKNKIAYKSTCGSQENLKLKLQNVLKLFLHVIGHSKSHMMKIISEETDCLNCYIRK